MRWNSGRTRHQARRPRHLTSPGQTSPSPPGQAGRRASAATRPQALRTVPRPASELRAAPSDPSHLFSLPALPDRSGLEWVLNGTAMYSPLRLKYPLELPVRDKALRPGPFSWRCSRVIANFDCGVSWWPKVDIAEQGSRSARTRLEQLATSETDVEFSCTVQADHQRYRPTWLAISASTEAPSPSRHPVFVAPGADPCREPHPTMWTTMPPPVSQLHTTIPPSGPRVLDSRFISLLVCLRRCPGARPHAQASQLHSVWRQRCREGLHVGIPRRHRDAVVHN